MAASVRPTLREDHHARLWTDRSGFLWSRRAWFCATGCPPVLVAPARYGDLIERSARAELPVWITQVGPRNWWWWQDEFYWDTGNYGAIDIKALVFKRQLRRERELEHAHAVMAAQSVADPARRREPIPDDVRRLVFRRDHGRCVACASGELIQYDHLIPFSLGGSNEPENLQLLCASCNREKGATL